MDFKDYYSTLGVAKTATEKEIKQAYRKLARKHHPDVNPGDKSAEAKFKEINEANEVLGDPVKRRKYDELGANWRMYEQAGAGQGPAGGPAGAPQGWHVDFGGGQPFPGGGYRTVTPDEMRDAFGGDPFSDFFHTFFGGAGGSAEPSGRSGRGGRARVRQGRDYEQVIELGLEDAYLGTIRRLAINAAGEERTVDVRIPAGIGDGSRVRVAGEGERGAGGGQPGDLYLRIHLTPHPSFERKGKDLYTRVGVPLTTAVLGGEAEVPTLSGRALRLKVPPTTANGQTLRLKGHGMPALGKPDQPGDLYATVDVQLPKELSPEQTAHFEALRKLEQS